MDKKKVNCGCCSCCCHHKGNCYRSKGMAADQSKLKSEGDGCEICGQNIPPKGFCGVKRLRCPCHRGSGSHGDGIFQSHSKEMLGIHVSQIGIDLSTVLCISENFQSMQYDDDVADDKNDHGKQPSRNRKFPWLDWRRRPLITNVGADEKHFTWHLKRKTPCIPDIYFQEMYDLNRVRYY